jgi:hypothetical protein
MDDWDERVALRNVCKEWPKLLHERDKQPAERQALIDRIQIEAAARRPILPLLSQLIGTSRVETVRSLGSGLPGTGPGRPDEERFVCPDGACDLVAQTDPGGPAPRCHVTSRPMKRA